MIAVAPYMGAWIETFQTRFDLWAAPVAPYMGAWIETRHSDQAVAVDCRRDRYGRGDLNIDTRVIRQFIDFGAPYL